MKKGFTLVEILIVVGIMAVLGVILTGSLIQTLRGQNKIRILNQVKQNGQTVLDKLTNEIRQTEEVIAVCTIDGAIGRPDDTILLKTLDEDTNEKKYTRFRLVPPTLTENGYLKRNDFTLADIRALAFEADGNVLCQMVENIDQLQVSSLTDRDSKTGVSVDYAISNTIKEPVFKLINPSAGFADTVMIKFQATAGVEAGYAYEVTVKEGGILFNTTAQVRGGR